MRKRRSNPDATAESWVGSRSFQLQSLVEWEFDARRAQPQPSRHGRQERYRQGHHQQRAGCRKVKCRKTSVLTLRMFVHVAGTSLAARASSERGSFRSHAIDFFREVLSSPFVLISDDKESRLLLESNEAILSRLRRTNAP